MLEGPNIKNKHDHTKMEWKLQRMFEEPNIKIKLVHSIIIDLYNKLWNEFNN